MIAPLKRRGMLLTLVGLMALAVAASAKLQATAPASAPAARSKAVKRVVVQAAKRPKLTLAGVVSGIQAKRQTPDATPAADLFAQKSWYVPPPPPPPPKPLPPPPPTAPPLPFSYLGNYQTPNGPLILFLTKGDQLYSVSPGDLIDGIYRVEGITSGQLGFTYLPLNIKQSLAVS
jgi:hypothetical protein